MMMMQGVHSSFLLLSQDTAQLTADVFVLWNGVLSLPFSGAFKFTVCGTCGARSGDGAPIN